REVLPLVGDVHRHVHVLHALVLHDGVDDLLHEVLLGVARDLVRILDDRRGPVDLIAGHGRELDVGLLGDRAGLRDVGGDARDPADLVFGDDRTAGEAPGAAVDHADAEARRADRAAGSAASPAAPAPRRAPRCAAPPPPPPPPAEAAPASPAASAAAEAADVLGARHGIAA